jgi:hypothetical protein
MSLRSRIAKVERVLAERKRKVDVANCVCKRIVAGYSGSAKELEAELRGTCPVHGFLLVDHIVPVEFVCGPAASDNEKEKTRREGPSSIR